MKEFLIMVSCFLVLIIITVYSLNYAFKRMGNNYKDFFQCAEDMMVKINQNKELRQRLEDKKTIEGMVKVKMEIYEETFKEEKKAKPETYMKMISLIEIVLNYMIVNYLLIEDKDFTDMLLKKIEG